MPPAKKAASGASTKKTPAKKSTKKKSSKKTSAKKSTKKKTSKPRQRKKKAPSISEVVNEEIQKETTKLAGIRYATPEVYNILSDPVHRKAYADLMNRAIEGEIDIIHEAEVQFDTMTFDPDTGAPVKKTGEYAIIVFYTEGVYKESEPRLEADDM